MSTNNVISFAAYKEKKTVEYNEELKGADEAIEKVFSESEDVACGTVASLYFNCLQRKDMKQANSLLKSFIEYKQQVLVRKVAAGVQYLELHPESHTEG